MKRLTMLFLLLCFVFSALPAMAGSEYLGDMEVVDCNEWVSMRKAPSTSAKRLVKVPLGAVVSGCRQVDDDWMYAEYEGAAGYILTKYLQPYDGISVCSAMIITNCENGTELYPFIGALEPIDFIAPDTIVRNCALEGNGWAYVEYGDCSGYVSAEHVVAYSDLLHFPQQITLLDNLFDGEYEGSPSALKVDDAANFCLREYDYSECVVEGPGMPRAEFVLYSDKTVSHVHLFSVSLRSCDSETGEAVFDARLEHIQALLDPSHPLSVHAVIHGTMPNLAVGYQDTLGIYHFAFVEISGEDGSLCLREF